MNAIPYTGQKCRNAEPGTFNHECGKPASVWIEYDVPESEVPLYSCAPAGRYTTYYCDKCAERGTEARRAKRLSVASGPIGVSDHAR